MLGILTLVVGPSGAGKDTMIRHARTALAGQDRYVFPQREITRPAGDRAEHHIAVSEAYFAERQTQGAYALSWRAHNLGYGVPRGIEDSLAAGRIVVVNASRGIVAEARARYANLAIVHVSAPEAALHRRLAARGRETHAEAAGRLSRAAAFDLKGPDVIALMNDRDPAHAVEEFLRILQGLRAAAA